MKFKIHWTTREFQKACFNGKKNWSPKSIIDCTWKRKNTQQNTQQNIRYIYSGLMCIITNCLFSLPISYHHSSFQIFIQLLHWCDFTSRYSFKQKRLSRLSLLYILALAPCMYYFLPKFLCIRVWLAARFSVQHNP